MLTLAILCSGTLGLKTLLEISKDYPIKFIFTNKNSEEIRKFAEDNNIPCFSGNPRNGKGYKFLRDIKVDVIVSINYLFLIEKDIIDHSKKLTFNIHGSLLPKYRGRTPHVWAIINGENKTGITAHKIDDGCDTGDIIYQLQVNIDKEDSGATILDKYAKLYYPLIKKVLSDVENDSLIFTKQNESEATYFGKRTPEDGEINWNWTTEKIRNWVRAQAKPYPGAFTFIDDKKIIIDKVSRANYKSIKKHRNGEVVQTNPHIIVKTNNGAVKLESIRTENCTFVKGNILSNENRK